MNEKTKEEVVAVVAPKITDALFASLVGLELPTTKTADSLIGGTGRRIVRVAMNSLARFAITELKMGAHEFAVQSAQAFDKAYSKVGPKVDADGDIPYDDADDLDENEPDEDENPDDE